MLLYGNGATKSVSIMYHCIIIHYMYHRFLILYNICIRYMLTLKMSGSLLNTPIYRSLQPLMLCMSYSGTLQLIDNLNEDFDAQECDNLLEYNPTDTQEGTTTSFQVYLPYHISVSYTFRQNYPCNHISYFYVYILFVVCKHHSL